MPGRDGVQKYFGDDITATEELETQKRANMKGMLEVSTLQCAGTLPYRPEPCTLPSAGFGKS